MRIGLVGNAIKVEESTVVQLQAFLLENGYEVKKFTSQFKIADVDAVIVLGGDGAILHAAVIAAEKGVKVIGINCGTLGFLTEYERDDAKSVLSLLKALENGQCAVLKRSLLKVTIKDKVYYALNELAAQRHLEPSQAVSSQLMHLEVNIGDEKDVIAGDGVLICTPTGSTAFSLSAGGAIIAPQTKVFMMTPICAFSMRSRPIVFPDLEKVVLKVQRGEALALIDGKAVDTVKQGEEIYLEKAPFYAEFPVHQGADFLSKIRNKLNK